MSQIKTLNGVQYTLPQYNDTDWGANTGHVLTQYIAAIADVTLQLSGGAFTLTADVNFGGTYGLVSAYFTSRTTGAASAGQVRLANTDTVKWRNGLGSADLSLAISTNRLTFEGSRLIIAGAAEIVNADISASAAIAYSKLALTGSIVNADVNASAAIAYSKLTLTGSIVNADVNASAAIAYSKLTLTGAILNADINASAAIAVTKMAALTINRAMVTDASGFSSVSAVTATELGYVSGVTSSIQTQLSAALTLPLAQNLTFDSYATHGVKGTSTNDSAASGNVGQYLSSVISSPTNTPADSTYGDLTSISLTAGDWDVTGWIEFSRNTATWTGVNAGVSSTSGNSSTGLTVGDNATTPRWASSATTPSELQVVLPAVRVSLSGTTIHYLKVLAVFSGGQPQAVGRLSARRVR